MVAKLIPPPNLDDLADVSVPTPGDQYFVYWDNATALWKCRALVDGDIPAAIARDAEVAAAVAAEAAARNAAIAAINLEDLADVQIPMPANLDFIYWDAVAGKWVNISYANLLLSIQGDTNLDDLHDVDVPAPADGEFLSYSDGLALWQSRLLADTDIPNLDAAKITTGRFGMPRMPDGALGQVLTAQGAGVDPAYAAGGGGGSKIQDADADTSWDVEQAADEDKVHGKVKGVEAFLLDDAGILTLAKQSGARAHKEANDQTISNMTITKVVLDGEDYDIQGEFDNVTNYRFTAKAAGLYLIVGHVYYAISVDQKTYQCRFHKNNAELQTLAINASGAKDLTVHNIAVAFLAANDYIELYAYQESGGNLILPKAYDATWLTVVKIA